MLETDRLSDCFEWIDLGFVGREATPKPAMKLDIRLHVAGLSLSDTVSALDKFGVDRYRTTVHNWVQKADQQPADDHSPDQVVLDETVIWINDDQYWLFVTVNLETNHLLHVRLFPTRTTVTTRMFFDELREKHQVDDATFLVDQGPWLHAAPHRLGLRFRHVTHGNRNAVERVFREVKRQTKQFSNCFSHVNPTTAENWLQAFAVYHNALI